MYRYTVMYEILRLTKQRKASVLQGLYRALKTEDWLKRLGLKQQEDFTEHVIPIDTQTVHSLAEETGASESLIFKRDF